LLENNRRHHEILTAVIVSEAKDLFQTPLRLEQSFSLPAIIS